MSLCVYARVWLCVHVCTLVRCVPYAFVCTCMCVCGFILLQMKQLKSLIAIMIQSDATMNLLKANRYQLMCAQNELIDRPPPIEAYNEYITTTKEKVSLI